MVSVTLTDMAVKLSRTAAQPGRVTFSVTNVGKVLHELVLLKTDLPQDQIPNDPTQGGLVMQPGYLGKVASLAPGGSGTLTLSLTAGPYVLLCNQPAHYLLGMHAAFTVAAGSTLVPTAFVASALTARPPISVVLNEMAIRVDPPIVAAGSLTFAVKNAGTVTHELVVLKSDLSEDKLPADPAAPGKVKEDGSLGEAGDLAPGATGEVTLTLSPGHYVLICNEPGHYAAGMHTTFTVVSLVSAKLSEMNITLDQASVPAGPVTFGVQNAGTVTHELVVLKTDLPEDKLPAEPAAPGKVKEDGNVGETDDVDVGHWSSFELTLSAGSYVLICNEPGHYAAGMHLSFTVK